MSFRRSVLEQLITLSHYLEDTYVDLLFKDLKIKKNYQVSDLSNCHAYV